MKHIPCIKQICTWIALEVYNNNDQQFNTHHFLLKLSLIYWYIDFVMIKYILNVHLYEMEFII